MAFWAYAALAAAHGLLPDLIDAVTGEKDLPAHQMAAQEAQAANLREVQQQLARKEKRTQQLRHRQGLLSEEAARFGGALELGRMGAPGVGEPGLPPVPAERAADPREMARVNGVVNPLLLSMIEADMGPQMMTGMENPDALLLE